MMRVLIHQDPFIRLHDESIPWEQRGAWPCAWVNHPDPGPPPFVLAYRKRFTLDRAATVRVHVSADERYELLLDGQRVGRGPERGDPANWFFETYDLTIPAGEHVIVARVWTLGPDMSPVAQMTEHPGFIFAPEGEFTEWLGTGLADWEVKLLTGYDFVHPNPSWGTGYNLVIDAAAFLWDFAQGAGEGWQPVKTLKPGMGRMTGLDFAHHHRLQPATLPAMLDEPRTMGTVRYVGALPDADAVSYNARPVHMVDHLDDEAPVWTALIHEQQPVTIPPHTIRQVIIDLDDYYCMYPEIVTSGGAGSVVKVLWEEALHLHPDPWNAEKGNRDDIDGKYFVGTGDTFLPDGGSQRRFDTLWWQAGRYVALIVQTADDPLTVERFTLTETRYPLANASQFAANDPRLAAIIPYMVRGLQMCMHETYMDCPYYEQLMYVGDTRLEVLVTYAITPDDRLPRKALRMFDSSRVASGLTQSRYPNRLTQFIPPFAVWWVAMLTDYALWRGDRAFVAAMMPGARAIMEGYTRFLNADGLIQGPEGWNFMDWEPSWPRGCSPESPYGVSAMLNWQYVLVLHHYADLETMLGEPALAERARQRAAAIVNCLEAFWNESRGLYADDQAQTVYTEHTQCLAILSGVLADTRRAQIAESLFTADDLGRTTIYFAHYLFETFRTLGRIDALLDRLDLWTDQIKYGAKTPFEKPEPSRSDCHAWGSHPLFHYFASILGIRPASLGFGTVTITPQLGSLASARGVMPHPRGEIAVAVRAENGTLHGSITLPEGITGTLHANGQSVDLHAGQQTF
ncbi:MAG: alpha-L-rhamnosidase [Anaerolineae bacterium]|nr:alpha-L-rhamnosidase [Anaerolineae bacterium]